MHLQYRTTWINIIFIPYAYDMAALVRQGNMNREDALEKLNATLSGSSIEEVQRKLNL